MSTVAERYARLCRCYIQLADRFAELDLENMRLKQKLVQLIGEVKGSQQSLIALDAEKKALTVQIELLDNKYQELKQFEALIDPAMIAELTEVEKQIAIDQEVMDNGKDDPLNLELARHTSYLDSLDQKYDGIGQLTSGE